MASSTPGACSRPAAPSSPTAAPPPATTRAPSGGPSSSSSAEYGCGTPCPTAAAPTSSTSGPAAALNRNRFQARLRADLAEVFGALRRGEITPQIAAELPLTQAAEAMRLAESGTVAGKVVLHA
ncbi:exported hypothetical protein [Streptomyces misionensis JCM 4497]